ncbi:MAG: hypothetical protein ABWY29_10640 [Blastococcus sp.]
MSAIEVRMPLAAAGSEEQVADAARKAVALNAERLGLTDVVGVPQRVTVADSGDWESAAMWIGAVCHMMGSPPPSWSGPVPGTTPETGHRSRDAMTDELVDVLAAMTARMAPALLDAPSEKRLAGHVGSGLRDRLGPVARELLALRLPVADANKLAAVLHECRNDPDWHAVERLCEVWAPGALHIAVPDGDLRAVTESWNAEDAVSDLRTDIAYLVGLPGPDWAFTVDTELPTGCRRAWVNALPTRRWSARRPDLLGTSDPLREISLRYAGALLERRSVARWTSSGVDGWTGVAPLVDDDRSLSLLTAVLRSLLADVVPVRSLEWVAEVVAEVCHSDGADQKAVARARRLLAPEISWSLTAPVLKADPELEKAASDCRPPRDDRAAAEAILSGARRAFPDGVGTVVTSSDAREDVREFLSRIVFGVRVLAREELGSPEDYTSLPVLAPA